MQTLNIQQCAIQIAGAMRANVPVMIWGPPGIGKSAIVAQTVAAEGGDDAPLIDIRLSQVEPADLRGIPYANADHTRTINLVPDFLPRESCAFGALFFDEITSAYPAVQAAAFQLILDRKIGQYSVPGGYRMAAAGNRLSDRGIVNPMPAPLANRFCHYEIAPDAPAWITWAKINNIDPRIIAYIQAVPGSLFNLDTSEPDIRAYASPRSWDFFSRELVTGTPPDLMTTACAYVGAAAGIDFATTVDILQYIPAITEILANPLACRVPDDSSNVGALASCFAIANMVAAAVCRDIALLDTVYPYLERLPARECIVVAMQDIQGEHGRDALIGTAAYRKFALEFAQDIV